MLYVEDNDANFTLVERVLHATARYRVERAVDAESALRYLEESPPPAVFLLDLDLPGMGGIELTAKLKGDASFARIPIVVITASVMQRERRRAVEAGADAFVEKPFDIDEFRKIIDSVLSMPLN